MPVISQNFSHSLESFTVKTNVGGMYNYQDTLVYVSMIVEASQYFFNDLKSMLEKITTLDITFSDNLTYEEAIAAPSFKIWGLDFSPLVINACVAQDSYIINPMIFRHYEYLPIDYSFKQIVQGSSHDRKERIALYSSRINNAERTEINYTIEITYNTDFIIIDYRPYADKSIKYTMCCLIKGEDINGKTVVYESGGCNTYSNGNPHESAYQWSSYHKLIWGETPKFNPYTNNNYGYPIYNCYYAVDNGDMGQTSIFMDFNGMNQVYPQTASIKYLDESPYNMSLFKPICCRGFVNFSDNILTGPIDLTVDTNYQINGETYYCPGDYVTKLSMEGGSNYIRHAMKFLLRI